MPKVPVMRTTAVDLILPNMPSLDVHDGRVGITKQEVILMYPGCTIHGTHIMDYYRGLSKRDLNFWETHMWQRRAWLGCLLHCPSRRANWTLNLLEGFSEVIAGSQRNHCQLRVIFNKSHVGNARTSTFA